MKASVLLCLALVAAPAISSAAPGRTGFAAADRERAAASALLIAGSAPAGRDKARAAERDWLALRAASCGHQARNACATRLTRQHTQALAARTRADRSYLKFTDKGLIRVEQRGWCWGPDKPKMESDQHWMRAGPTCSREAA